MEKLEVPKQHLSKGVRDQEVGRAWTGRAWSRSSLASLPLTTCPPQAPRSLTSPALPLLPCPAAQGPLCLLPSPRPEPCLTCPTGCLCPGVWRYSMRTGCDHMPGVPCRQPLGHVRKFLGARPQPGFGTWLSCSELIPDVALHISRAAPVGPERLPELLYSPPRPR